MAEAATRRQNKRDYRFTNCVQEDHGKPIYGVAFNLIDLRASNAFAAVGSNRVSVYECAPTSCPDIHPLQVYVDEDAEEVFYCVAWASDKHGAPLIVAGGLKGIIRIIDCVKEEHRGALVGHGNSINDLKLHPLRPQLLLSASKDHSLRLWNIATGVCILILTGDGSHANEVLSADFRCSPDGDMVASSGMDNTVHIWSLKGQEALIEKSFDWPPKEDASKPASAFPTRYLQHPIFSTHSLHLNYIDCVRWLGSLLLTKSVDNKIVLWRNEDNRVRVLQEYRMQDCDVWFIRFSLDFHLTTLSIGTRDGKIYVWDVHACPPHLYARLSHSRCKAVIRQTATSMDGRTILACCEDGTIWRWDDMSSLTS